MPEHTDQHIVAHSTTHCWFLVGMGVEETYWDRENLACKHSHVHTYICVQNKDLVKLSSWLHVKMC